MASGVLSVAVRACAVTTEFVTLVPVLVTASLAGEALTVA